MLRIGDFSRLSRVTIKALRTYDRVGLLRPARVEPTSGYRLYDASQLETVSHIVVLKDLGFRLNEIRHLISHPSALDAALEERRHSLHAAIAADRLRVRRLDAFRVRLADSAPAPPVVVRVIAPALALTAREVVRQGDGRVTRLFERLERDAGRARLRADASPFLLFQDGSGPEDRLDVEVCIPVTPRAEGLVDVRTVEGAATAGCLVYRGDYGQTPPLFTRLAEWIALNGGAIAGPLREVYHRFGAERRGYALPERVLAHTSAEFVTELQAPMNPPKEAAA